MDLYFLFFFSQLESQKKYYWVKYIYLNIWSLDCCCLVAKQLWLTLLQPYGLYSLPGSSVHGILQARLLEWLPFPSPGYLPDPGIEPVSPALAGGFFTTEPPGKPKVLISSAQFSSVAQSCPTLCDPMDCTPGFPVHHQLPDLTQTHVHRVGDTIQSSHLLSSPFPAFNLSQHQGLFQWINSSHQVAKVLEFQLQHQSF